MLPPFLQTLMTVRHRPVRTEALASTASTPSSVSAQTAGRAVCVMLVSMSVIMIVWVWVSERPGGVFLGGRCEQQHKFTSLGNSLNKSCCLWVTHPTATKEWSAVWESLEDKTMEDLFWQSKRAEKCGNLASWLILNLFCEQHMPTNTVQFVLSVCTFADDTIAYIT